MLEMWWRRVSHTSFSLQETVFYPGFHIKGVQARTRGCLLPVPPLSPFPHPVPFPTPPLSSSHSAPHPLPPLEVGPLNPGRDLGEHCNIRQRRLGSPSRNWIWCILALKSDIMVVTNLMIFLRINWLNFKVFCVCMMHHAKGRPGGPGPWGGKHTP